MATMVKERSRDKKKSKSKHSAKNEESTDFTEDSCKAELLHDSTVNEPAQIPTDQSNDVKTGKTNEKSSHEQRILSDEDNRQMSEIDDRPINQIDNRQFSDEKLEIPEAQEIVEPSAPVLEQNEPIPYVPKVEIITKIEKTINKCLPLEEAVRLFGGKEISEVRSISEYEDAKVEAGPQCEPNYPLIDYLCTFRSSLKAVERERNRISTGYIEEEKSRATLWKVNKRTVNVSEKCPCGATVSLKASFDVAHFDKERLPAARMQLESLSREIEDSYCHHQHIALQTHYDIDEFLYQILQTHKENIHDALSLIFQALRLSDGAPDAYAQALQRWTSILCTALLDGDSSEPEALSYLTFVLHSLFRQTRSVQWAGHVFTLQVTDMSSAARMLGILEVMLTRPVLESAQECTEDAWEEVDEGGEGCAVGEGRLRERDLLTLLQALPMRDLVARLTLFMQQDVTQVIDEYWGDHSGGHGVLKSSCGVRTLLDILQRAHDAHASYTKLQRKLKHIGVSALKALAALHMHCNMNYSIDLKDKINTEMEACFAAGVTLLQDEAYKIPATLLTDQVAFAYAFDLQAVHYEEPIHIEHVSLEIPWQSCIVRTRMVVQVALDRELDHNVAKLVLEALFKIGINKLEPRCRLGCADIACEMMPKLLDVHPRLHTSAFQTLAEMTLSQKVDPALIDHLSCDKWRPEAAEARVILADWAIKCFDLIQHLLLRLDYTPHTGLSLETQLMIGKWLCEFAVHGGEAPEWAWQVLRLLSVHRSQWRLPLEAPPHEKPKNLFSMAFMLLSSDLGHSLPLICGPGVEDLYTIALARPTDAVHCVSNVMQVMALSPESVTLTPKFTEIFSVILSSGPSLVQRALGRRGSTGHDLLQQRVVLQVLDAKSNPSHLSALVYAWLHALWKPSLPASSRALLDVVMRSCNDWRTLDMHANNLLQEENAKEYIQDAVRHAAQAPLLCESILRMKHMNEINSQMYARLLEELVKQKSASQRIHVDNALKNIGMSLSDDDLMIHKCACAVLAVSVQHPAQLLLWRLLLHMFLQRPPLAQSESVPPVGPLFFSGLVKSRTLAQLKKRLQETSVFHHTQILVLKSVESSAVSSPSSEVMKPSTSVDTDMFQTLAIIDLTGVTNNQSDCTPSDDGKEIVVKETSGARDMRELLNYHVGAEKLIREYLLWLEEGERVHAQPYHADITRFITETALDTAWRASLGTISSFADTPPLSQNSSTAATPDETQAIYLSHCERAIRAVMSIKDGMLKRYKIPPLPQPLDDVYFTDTRLLYQTVDKYLKELRDLSEQWNTDVCRIAQLDFQLWEYVRELRVSRPLPPVRKSCPQGCKPITIHISENEWCESNGAVKGIEENRRSSRAAIRILTRPRPYVARLTSIVHSMGGRINRESSALEVAERAYRVAAYTCHYAAAHDAVTALITNIAQRFISQDSRTASEYLSRWMRGGEPQQKLCTALIAPLRMNPTTWPKLYNTVLTLHLEPHVAFSFLSKFDMATWAVKADSSSRSEVLESLVQAALRMGPDPDAQEMVLLEILCRHSSVIVRQSEVFNHILRCTHASVSCHLPPLYLQHLPDVVIKFSRGVNFDSLGLLLRELGYIFWEARSATEISRVLYAQYAPHLTKTLYNLVKVFVAAGLDRGYDPERVGKNASSALHESWSAWVLPHSAPPLIPDSNDDQLQELLKLYTDNIIMVMEDSPDSSRHMLRYVWEWTITKCTGVAEGAVLGGALLAQLIQLPWNQPWFHVECLVLVPQITTQSDQKVRSWCCDVMHYVKAEDWLNGSLDENVPIHLHVVLSFLTNKQMAFHAETLEEACKLPWHRLPVPAAEEAFDRYFMEHFTQALPYHQQPHFRLMLAACQLYIPEGHHANISRPSAEKRTNAISQWLRAATAPTLNSHVREYTLYLLNLLANLAPHIETSPGELEALIGRAIVIMCMEPAAAISLPVWEHWISTSTPKIRHACATAVATLTTLDYFAALADVIAKHIMNENLSSWSEIAGRWCLTPWSSSQALVNRRRLYAAYAMLHVREHSHTDMRHVFRALNSAEIDFSGNEVIIAVWICVACRVIVQNVESEDEATSSERRECVEAARALLVKWAEQRRTLLQLVTLHPAGNCPMTQHRVLCRLALCIVSPSDSAARSYESAVSAVLPAPDVIPWGRARNPRTLPRLACRLFPASEAFFKEEQERVPEVI